jgi:amicyanin
MVVSMKRASLIILVAVLLFFSGVAHADTAQVSIKDSKFRPDTVTVKKGDTVTWTNMDTMTHDVKFKDAESPDMKKGETYSRTFDKAGTFDYICEIHPYMKGKVVVT